MEEELKHILQALSTTNGKSTDVIKNLHETIAQASSGIATPVIAAVPEPQQQPLEQPLEPQPNVAAPASGGRHEQPHLAGPNGEIFYR